MRAQTSQRTSRGPAQGSLLVKGSELLPCRYQIEEFSTLSRACPSFFPLYSDQNNSRRRCDITAPSAEVFLQMSAASPEESHMTISRTTSEEERLLSDCPGLLMRAPRPPRWSGFGSHLLKRSEIEAMGIFPEGDGSPLSCRGRSPQPVETDVSGGNGGKVDQAALEGTGPTF